MKPKKITKKVGDLLDMIRNGELDLEKKDLPSLEKAIEKRNAAGRYKNKL